MTHACTLASSHLGCMTPLCILSDLGQSASQLCNYSDVWQQHRHSLFLFTPPLASEAGRSFTSGWHTQDHPVASHPNSRASLAPPFFHVEPIHSLANCHSTCQLSLTPFCNHQLKKPRNAGWNSGTSTGHSALPLSQCSGFAIPY